MDDLITITISAGKEIKTITGLYNREKMEYDCRTEVLEAIASLEKIASESLPTIE